MRIGIFGGSFDPPHLGHLLAATDALEQLRLDRLVFVPASTQPLKRGLAVATAEHRLAMTRIAVAGEERFLVSDVELRRAGVSFTVDTLRHFAETHGSAERFLVLGADAVALFSQWREPERVVGLARLAVLRRGDGQPVSLPAGIDASRVEQVATRRIDISSTEIRDRVRQGRSMQWFVTDGVARYIEQHRLYR